MHPTDDDTRKPTAKQQRYLRVLAEQTGSTFVRPTTIRHASAEIKRLKELLHSDKPDAQLQRGDAEREKRQVQDDLAAGAHDAVRYAPNEVSGYGSSARWTGRD
jgi:hypothetical protein